MKIYWKETGALLAIASVIVLGTTARIPHSPGGTAAASAVPQEETAVRQETRRLASEALHLRFEGKAEPVHSANFAGIRSENLTFTRRLDSRTFLAYDRRFSSTTKYGMYGDADEQMLRKTRDILEGLKIPSSEIESARILQERTQLGHRDGSGKMLLEKVESGKKYALVTRQVGGVPVFSSRAMIGLMKQGEIGFLEVHWPEIPKRTIEQTIRYREAVEKGWHAPPRAGARVESVTAGIVHSPAAGTAMDIYPVIRVIYAPEDKRFGKKPVGYFDLEGNEIPPIRTFLEPPREDVKRERTAPSR